MDSVITLDYGSGGKKTAALIDELIVPVLGNPFLNTLSDGAVLPSSGQIVFSTDSFVVSPWRFPGGDIGKLAVCGTVNDIAVSGGRPRFISLSLILEEGFPTEDLREILRSLRRTADEAGVKIVTGDTKVVERGKADGIYINTSGIGELVCPGLTPETMRPGDRVLLSGPAGDHGTAVMLARHSGLLEGELPSDCGPMHRLCGSLFALGPSLRVMRDPTRGGNATTLCELAEKTACSVELDEEAVPVRPGVRSACDLLGLDPLYCACEGRILAVAAPDAADEALCRMRELPEGSGAEIIGEVRESHPGKVCLRTAAGGTRILTKLSGAQLPRIC